jgi:hypothetical protein
MAMYVREHPGEFAGSLVDWQDLSKGNLAKWAGHMTPMAIGIVLTKGLIGGAGGAGAPEADAILDEGAGAVDQVAVHGNSLASPRLATLYQLTDTDGNLLKWVITSRANPLTRYTQSFMSDKFMIPVAQGSRAEMAGLERALTERIPGPLNLRALGWQRVRQRHGLHRDAVGRRRVMSETEPAIPDLLALGVSSGGISPANQLVHEALRGFMKMVIKERAAFPNEGGAAQHRVPRPGTDLPARL